MFKSFLLTCLTLKCLDLKSVFWFFNVRQVWNAAAPMFGSFEKVIESLPVKPDFIEIQMPKLNFK